jgi:hypothetical protein
MSVFTLLEHAALALAVAIVIAAMLERSRIAILLPALVGAIAALSGIVLVALVANHVRFPFNLDVMEGVMMQHARRVLHGQSIYPAPTPDYVPLAYNALFYLFSAPFLAFFGDSLLTLRLVAVLGFVGSAAGIYALVQRATGSRWWSAIAVGLFCAAYAAMDARLDTAHSDSWMLCCALWGTYLVARSSRSARLVGVLVLVASFWFKQHGALFVAGALLYLTWREGARASLGYWALAFLLGPLLYLFASGFLGPDFHYFTWHVPSGWSQPTIRTIPRVALFVAASYPVLAVLALWGVYRAFRMRSLELMDVQFGVAVATGIMGSLDVGSSYNVFIPLGAFCIVRGSIELARLDARAIRWRGNRLSLACALLAFATLLRDPAAYWLPSSAAASYAELQDTVRKLPGPVYAPGIGQFVDGPRLHPAAHWVALDDLMRGTHSRSAADSTLARSMIAALCQPAHDAFILTNVPLATLSAPVNELSAHYALVRDFGSRFEALKPLPGRFDTGWPRYLYQFEGSMGVVHAP